jgi:hypothetical protein
MPGLEFMDRPARSPSLVRKWLKEWPRWISFRHAAYEYGRNISRAILAKTHGCLEAAKAEIAKPRAHKITCLSRLQSPEIQLTFPTRKPPALAELARYVTEICPYVRRKQVQRALSVVWNEGV